MSSHFHFLAFIAWTQQNPSRPRTDCLFAFYRLLLLVATSPKPNWSIFSGWDFVTGLLQLTSLSHWGNQIFNDGGNRYRPQPDTHDRETKYPVTNWSSSCDCNVHDCYITLYSWCFPATAGSFICWSVQGHMTSHSETVSRQMPWAGNIAKTMTSNGKHSTITREMLTAVARHLSIKWLFCFPPVWPICPAI